MGLLNDVMSSADCSEFTSYMQSIYFAHKRKIKSITPREYVEFAEKEYRTLYRDNKWSAVKTDPDSSFYSGDIDQGRGDGGRGRGRGRGGRGNNRWAKCECHNCGKMGHISLLCWLPGGGAHKSGSDQGIGGSSNDTTATFPGTDGDALTRPPRYNEPRHKKLANGEDVVWCSKCSKWIDHFTAGHPASSTNAVESAGATPAGDASNE